ncbi:MAG: periplasmic heavy metal sensor [Gemmatimonadetes bacterium]|nr:periplasmic heavy metal sensor [Gemmatimonadota bacterium]
MNRFALIVMAIVSMASTGLAQQPAPAPPPPQPPPDSGFGMHLFPPELVMQQQRRLGLTAQQREVITAGIKELQGQVIDLQWRMQDEEQRLSALLDRPSVDAVAALAQVDRLLDVERQVKKAHLGLLIKIKNALTAEQQDILGEIRAGAPNRPR